MENTETAFNVTAAINAARRSRKNIATPLDTMRLAMEKATVILKLIVEGTSIRSVERITQAGKLPSARNMFFHSSSL